MVKLGITAVVATAGLVALSGSDSEEEPTHAAVCVDQETNTRVEDSQCAASSRSSHFGWFFFAYGYTAPRVGAPINSPGSFTPPRSGTYVKGGVPRAGGLVSSSTVKGGTSTTVRGGFGSNSKGSGG
ncbi:hypothetical protein [Gephyromycinifex aptenodytis]|uniref:hypothetical protein n=1 Tax=Gephyromycinifex aptenodytis TaxID=2716227 RepID=UPI001444CB71|nr:hypothetical protein [Gephyromycinifex aptenodytis]